MDLMNIGLKGDTAKIFSMKETDFNEEVFNEFSFTEDASIEEGKTYYSLDNSVYKEKVPESNPKEEGLYEAKIANLGYLDFSDSLISNGKVAENLKLDPEVASYDGVRIDTFCEKPAYIPPDYKGIYFPLGDNLIGYDLQDFISANKIQAKGKAPENPPDYYKKAGGFSKKEVSVDSSVEGLFVDADGLLPLDRGNNDVRTVYSPVNFKNEDKTRYGRNINFSYDGLKPGSLDCGNLLRYDEGRENWKDNWHNCDVELSGNIYRASDGLILRNITSTTCFEKTILLPEGTYTFSFFIKADDTDGLNGRLIYDNPQKGLICPASKNDNTFEVSTSWERKYRTLEVSSEEESITLKISFDQPNHNCPIKICGMMLNEGGYPKTYNPNGLGYDGKEIDDIKMPLDIYFLDDKRIDPSKDWSLMYKRKIDIPKGRINDFYLVDSIGDAYFGYKNGKTFIGKKPDETTYDNINSSEITIADKNRSYTENVLITYNRVTESINYYVYTFVDSKNRKHDSYHYSKNLPITIDRLVGTIPQDNVKYNLLLGGCIEKDENDITNLDMPMSATYSDLIIIEGKCLTENEWHNILNIQASITPAVMYYENYHEDEDSKIDADCILKKDILALRSYSIIETNH